MTTLAATNGVLLFSLKNGGTIQHELTQTEMDAVIRALTDVNDMTPASEVSDEEWDVMHGLHELGVTYDELSTIYHVDAEDVRDKFHASGWTHNNVVGTERERLIVDHYLETPEPMRVIAERYGISTVTVTRILDRNGIERPHKHRRATKHPKNQG